MTIDHVRLKNILFSVITKICKDMNSLDWGCVRLSYVIYNSLSLEGLKVFKYKNILICVMYREQRSIIFLNMKVSLKCRCTWIVFSTLYGILKTNTLAPSTPLLQILVQSYFFLYLSRLILFLLRYTSFTASVWPAFPTTSKSMVCDLKSLLFGRMRTFFFVHASRSSRAFTLLTRSLGFYY